MSTKKSPPEHAALISRYHALLKHIEGVDKDQRFPTRASKVARKRVLRAELQAMGGIEAYQAASRAGEARGAGYDCSKWVISELGQLLKEQRVAAVEGLRLLDVGAIVPRFPASITSESESQTVALQVKSIDLNPQDPQVERADFFDLARDYTAGGKQFDVIVLSLVLNFVPSPVLRGEMLSKAHEISASNGILFIVLPLASLSNSRYCDEAKMREILLAVGWQVLSFRASAKLAFFVCKRETRPPVAPRRQISGKELVRSGAERNNFAVALGCANESAAAASSRTRQSSGRSRQNPTSPRAPRAKPKLTAGVDKKTTSNQRRKARRKAKKHGNTASGARSG